MIAASHSRRRHNFKICSEINSSSSSKRLQDVEDDAKFYVVDNQHWEVSINEFLTNLVAERGKKSVVVAPPPSPPAIGYLFYIVKSSIVVSSMLVNVV